MGEFAGMKVMIVEDDRDASDMMKLVLQDAGYIVVQAFNAPDGLEKARFEQPDVILLDVMMPAGTEGFNFVWDLRKDANIHANQIPIIILSAIHSATNLRFYPDQDDPEYKPYEYLPVQAFLDKPAKSEELIATVDRVLRGTGPSATGK